MWTQTTRYREHRRDQLAPGIMAPDFTLHDKPDHTVSLSESRGRPVPKAMGAVCDSATSAHYQS
jgi:peroxiredoxin